MWELDHKESWAPKNWCFWTVVLEKTFESPLNCPELKPVHPKGNQPWIFIGKADVEASILWPLDMKSWFHWKRLWCWERLKTKGDDRGWDGWMASLIQWTWVWANSRRKWRVGKPGVLQSMGSQRVRHNDSTTTTNPRWLVSFGKEENAVWRWRHTRRKPGEDGDRLFIFSKHNYTFDSISTWNTLLFSNFW